MKVSIIIPAHNEEKRIGRTLEEYGKFFNNKKKNNEIVDFEILIIINNTHDRTEEIVKKLAKKYKEIRYLNFEQGGKGFAIIEGFKETLKYDFDLIGFVDADMSTSPEEYFKLIKNIGNYDGIIASRYVKGALIKTKQPLKRVIISRLGNFIIRVLFFIPYRDTQCGAKILRKKAIEKIVSELGMTHWAIDIDMLYRLKKKNFKIKEFPTIWEDEIESKLNLKKASTQVLFAIIQLRMLNSPLKKTWKMIKPFAEFLWKSVR